MCRRGWRRRRALSRRSSTWGLIAEPACRVRSRLTAGASEIRTVGPPRAETARGFRGPARYRLSSRFVSAPFCELGPAGTDQTIGIFGGHLDDAILSDGDASA